MRIILTIFVIILIIFGVLIAHYYGILGKLSSALIIIATVITSIINIIKEIFGSHKTRLNIRYKEKELDLEAFKFLTENPPHNKRQHLTNFNAKINTTIYITKSKSKKYDRYKALSEEFDVYEDNSETIFYKILKEAQKLATKIDKDTRVSGLQKLFRFAARAYWKKNIFCVRASGLYSNDQHSSVLVYYHTTDSGGSGGNTQETQAVRQLIDHDLKNKSSISSQDNFYIDDSLSDCRVLYPSDDYEFIAKGTNWICRDWILIKYKNKNFKLYYCKPKTFQELGL